MNMILHCTICDDNPSAVKREKEIADRAFGEMNISADISVYTDSSQFMFELGDNKQMDILILDIEMPKMSGFEIADYVKIMPLTDINLIFSDLFQSKTEIIG